MDVRDQLESVLREFDRAWHAGDEPQIDAYLDRLPALRTELLAELVFSDIEYRLALDDRTRVEDYFERYPELKTDAVFSTDLIAHEIRLRRKQDQLEEYEERFPDHFDEVAKRLSFPIEEDCNALWERIEPLLPPTNGHGGTIREFVAGDLLGRYRIIEEAGRGGFAIVYKAFDTQLNRFVAIKASKTLSPASSPDLTNQLLLEARHVAKLRHRSIVPVLDVLTHEDSLYLVSEFIEGETLAEKWPSKATDYHEMSRVLSEVADALHFAHLHRVIHGDVKPSNIILDSSDIPHVTDFGLSINEDETSFRSANAIWGTPAYLSPEQAQGDMARIDARTDIYSLGVVTYRLLTGELPFQGQRNSVIEAVVKNEPIDVRERCRDVPHELATICMRALEKDPSRRFASAFEMAEEFGRFARGEVLASQPASLHARLRRALKRNRKMTFAIAVLVVSLFATFAFVARNSKSPAGVDNSNLEVGKLTLESVDQLYRTLEEEMGRSAEAVSIRERLANDSEEYFRRVYALRPDDPAAQAMLAHAVYQVGVVNFQMNSHLDAAQKLRVAREHWQQVFEKNPSEAEIQYRLVKACDRLGMALQRVKDYDDAVKSMELAEQLASDLVNRYPNNPACREKLADVYHHLRGLWDAIGQTNKKEAAARSAYKQLEVLVKTDPDKPAHQRRLAELSREIGASGPIGNTRGRLKPPSADTTGWDLGRLARARAIQEELIRKKQEMPWVAIDLSATMCCLAHAKFNQDRTDFRYDFQRACNVLRGLTEQYADVERVHLDLAHTLTQFAKCEMSIGSLSTAKGLFEEASEHYRIFLSNYDQSGGTYLDLAAALIQAGNCCDELGNRDDATRHFNAAAETISTARQLESFPPKLRDGFDELDLALAARDLAD